MNLQLNFQKRYDIIFGMHSALEKPCSIGTLTNQSARPPYGRRVIYTLSRTLRALDNRRVLPPAGREALRASQPANAAGSACRQASLPTRLRLIRGDYTLSSRNQRRIRKLSLTLGRWTQGPNNVIYP